MVYKQYYFSLIDVTLEALLTLELWRAPIVYDQYVVIKVADKLYNSVTVLFLCFAKVCLSHRSQVVTGGLLAALQHSLLPNVCSYRLDI